MDYKQFLRSVDILQRLPDDQLARLAGRLKPRRFDQGRAVLRRGDPSEAMYLVFEGRVKTVTTDAGGQERVLAFHDEGSFFGEMALLAEQPQVVDAYAVTDTTLLELRCEDFNEWVASHPTVSRELLRLLAERQAQSNSWLPQPAAPSAGGPQQGRIFTVYGSRGGVGKTTVSVNLAVALAQFCPEQAVLVDLALTFGHAALLLDLQPRTSLAGVSVDALREFDRDTLDRYLVPHFSTLRLLAGSLHPEEGEKLTNEHVKVLLGLLGRFFNYVIVDTGANFMDPTLAALEGANRIIYVLTPELTTLQDLVESRRIFDQVVHVPTDRFYFLLNYPYAVSALSREQFEEGLGRPVHRELPYGGDTAMQAQARGEAFVACQPGTPLARGIDRLARELAGVPERTGRNGKPAGAAKREGLFSFLGG